MLIGYWAAIFAALLILPPDDGLARAQGLDKNAQEQVLMELEAAELKANETFSRSVPPRTSLSDAKDKGYVASRAAAITYDEESESFLRTAIAWFRWAALQGNGSAAEAGTQLSRTWSPPRGKVSTFIVTLTSEVPTAAEAPQDTAPVPATA
jgi:hypothetical protein